MSPQEKALKMQGRSSGENNSTKFPFATNPLASKKYLGELASTQLALTVALASPFLQLWPCVEFALPCYSQG